MKLPTYFISHGGGPWPYMKTEFGSAYDLLEASLKQIPNEITVTPQAILIISAHWEEREFTVMSNPKPPMLYDYSGFPAHTYQVQYNAPGSTELAQKVQNLIQQSGLPAHFNTKRGFDHGTFAPLAVMFPDANIPVVQLSLKTNLDPEVHLQLGRILSPLRSEGILIIGSGLSYHNLRQFQGAQAKKASREFDNWLNETLVASKPEERIQKLNQWQSAPSARIAHPREEHLIPLMVAVGAAQDEVGKVVYHEEAFMGDLTVSSFRFGK